MPLGQYIAGNLHIPPAVPLAFTDLTVTIREIRRVRITPRLPADYPPVDLVALLCLTISATATRREVARDVRTAAVPAALLGLWTFAVYVDLSAAGAAVGGGYELTPRRARLTTGGAKRAPTDHRAV